MAKKDQYKHTFNVVVEMSGDDIFKLNNPEEIAPIIEGLQDRMKQSYNHCKKPEKVFLYILATNDMGIIEKLGGGDNGEADK